MNTTYTMGGIGGASPDLVLAMASAFPERDSGPNCNLHIDFPNGVTLSLVWGWGAYAGADTVEVAVIPHDDGGWLTGEVAKAAFGEDIDDMVDGYCNAERVHGYFVAAQGWPSC